VTRCRMSKKGNKATLSVSHGRAVSSARISPDGLSVLTTSLDDTIRVTPLTQATTKATVISHCNQTGRWLSKFRAIWLPTDGVSSPSFVVGSMDQPRGIDVYAANGTKIIRLESDNQTSITSAHAATHNAIVGGNSSGKIFLWR